MTEKRSFSARAVLARITEGPIRFCDLAGSKNYGVRRPLRATVDKLTAKGLIRVAYIDRSPHLVLMDWDFSDELKLQVIVNKSRRMVDGCLEWTGYVDPERGPMACIGKNGIPTSIRRTIWAMKRGALEYQQTVRVKCENERCIEYGHMVLGRREDKTTGKSITPLHRARIARTHQARGKLDWSKVRRIRRLCARGIPDAPIARRFGVKPATVAQVRRYETWREEGGMFTSLIPGRAVA